MNRRYHISLLAIAVMALVLLVGCGDTTTSKSPITKSVIVSVSDEIIIKNSGELPDVSFFEGYVEELSVQVEFTDDSAKPGLVAYSWQRETQSGKLDFYLAESVRWEGSSPDGGFAYDDESHLMCEVVELGDKEAEMSNLEKEAELVLVRIRNHSSTDQVLAGVFNPSLPPLTLLANKEFAQQRVELKYEDNIGFVIVGYSFLLVPEDFDPEKYYQVYVVGPEPTDIQVTGNAPEKTLQLEAEKLTKYFAG